VRGTFLLLALLCYAPELSAEDPFEIHVYEYEPLSWRDYSLEAHINFVTQGRCPNLSGRVGSRRFAGPDGTLDFSEHAFGDLG
jgi:hypothetical protein